MGVGGQLEQEPEAERCLLGWWSAGREEGIRDTSSGRGQGHAEGPVIEGLAPLSRLAFPLVRGK